MSKIMGFVFYEGKSAIDGKPIVGIATLSTSNEKTGDMIQTWIMRSDIHPQDAVKTGEDCSVCGDCPLRGEGGKNRACYVKVFHAPRGVWTAYKRGAYSRDPEEYAKAVKGRPIRLGAYGEPVAIPVQAWKKLLQYSSGWTGYTHQWKKFKGAFWQNHLMASCQKPEERETAKKAGWRTFRIVDDEQNMEKNEILCPALQGKTQCSRCQLCQGTTTAAKDVTVIAHGNGSKYVA